jgi:nucleotide-binding universal stress UspA family protein
MSASTNPPPSASTTVLVAALEGDADLDIVMSTALGLARTMPNATIHVSHVIPAGENPKASDTAPTLQLQYARTITEKAVALAAAKNVACVAHVSAGKPSREVLQLAMDVHADVVVVGTHGRTGVNRLVMGSSAEYIVRHAQCAVVVARRKDYSATVPEIEPACPDCLAVQRETEREKLWCARHASTHVHGRLHYETPAGYGRGSMFVRP